MAKPSIQIGNEVREMTDAEYEQHLLDVAVETERVNMQLELDNARKSALAKLAALGLSETEIKALVG